MNLGENILYYMRRAQIPTVRRLARLTVKHDPERRGISENLIYQITGPHPSRGTCPSSRTIEAIAGALGISVEQLRRGPARANPRGP